MSTTNKICLSKYHKFVKKIAENIIEHKVIYFDNSIKFKSI
jgi:hypothetical protein